MAAESNVPLERLDRENGLVVSKPVYLAPNDTLADCGKAQGFKARPTQATWNVFVTGDSTRSFVRMNIAYARVGAPRTILARVTTSTITESCATLGTAEASIEKMIRTRAEVKSP